ncbi:TAF5-like RNA polymerase II p300/CBP-associated factor-associated factor subunit 5L [Nymphon striatum]|nr:TAF5-like RNA polymerase II p300/CBP-associated factor-associated factor subunit 5L [Nymphon striatum]
MKRSRHESNSSHVNGYMKRRQLEDQDYTKKSDCKREWTINEMAFEQSLCNNTASKNMFSYSSFHSDLNSIEQQYSRLKGFISDSCEPMKTELTHLLFPTFFYLYKELLVSSKPAAQKYFEKNIQMFINNSLYEPIIKRYFPHLLNNSLCESDDSDKVVMSMADSHRFRVKLTREASDYLNRFLKGYKQTTILQILNRDLMLQISPIEVCDDNSEIVAPNDNVSGNILNGVIEAKENRKDGKMSSLDALNDCIRRVNESKPSLPSMCNYSLSSPYIRVCSIDISSDLTMLCAGYADSSIRLYNLTPVPFYLSQGKSRVSTLNLRCDTKETDDNESYIDIDSHSRILRGHCGNVYAAKFLSKNNMILSCSRDATVRAWNLETLTNTAVYFGHNYPIWALDISPMEHYFVTASHDRTARLWSFDRNYPLRTFGDGHITDVDTVSFHPNCNYVATGSSDRTVRLWDVQKGSSVRSFYGNRNSVMALAFSPNGKLLAAAGEDKRIKIWDLASGNTLKDLRGHTDTIFALKFSSDSSILASGGADESIRLWDITKESCSNTPSNDGNASPELLSHNSVKSCSIMYMRYTNQNVLYTSGKIKHSPSFSTSI